MSKEDGEYRNCNNAVINYRPKFCSYPQDDECVLDWNTVTNMPGKSPYCGEKVGEEFKYSMHGLFLASNLYADLRDSCGFKSVRIASYVDPESVDENAVDSSL